MALTLILGSSVFANPSENPGYKMINGQHVSQPLPFYGLKIFKSTIDNLAALKTMTFKDADIEDVKNISTRALKDFQGRFGDAGEIVWYSDANGFTSYFTKDGFRDRANYNKNGRWLSSLIYYNQEKLPENIRTAVKSTYSDLKIYVVVEVQSNYGKAYIVYLENKSNIRVLKVTADGEMETIMESLRG
jgi:hypothetical protein